MKVARTVLRGGSCSNTASLPDLKENMPEVVILRNEVLPTKVPAGGLVIVRDGDPGEPDITLSPTRYHYQHCAEVEVLVQQGNQLERDEALDRLLQMLEQTLALNLDTCVLTLGGAVDYLHIGTPEFLSETTEGAPPIKAAVVPVILEYSTMSPFS